MKGDIGSACGSEEWRDVQEPLFRFASLVYPRAARIRAALRASEHREGMGSTEDKE